VTPLAIRSKDHNAEMLDQLPFIAYSAKRLTADEKKLMPLKRKIT
jgi:hypothetical protein